MDEDEYGAYYILGEWQPISSVYCKEADENFQALDIKCQLVLVENANGEGIEVEDVAWNDTLYIVPSDVEGNVFVCASDLRQLAEMEQSSALTRGWIDDIIGGIKKAAQMVVDGASKVVEKVGEGLVKGYEAVKKAVEASVRFVKKVVARSYPVIVKGNSDWMGTIYKDKNPLLREISIPGTHDTFTYDFGNISGQWASTQVYNIDEQFDAGVRYFDMRFKGSGFNLKKIKIVVGSLWLSHELLTSITAKDAFGKIVNQLKAHPDETVICELAFDGDDSQELVDRLNVVLKGVTNYIVDLKDLSGDIRLNDCRGKIVLIQRFPTTFTNANFGFYMGSTNMSQNNIVTLNANGQKWDAMVQNFYECDLTDQLTLDPKKYQEYIDTKMRLIKENLADAAKDASRWHFNFTSGYFKVKSAGITFLNYPSIATFANKVALDYINEHKGDRTGIVAMDFAGLDTEGAVSTTDVYGDKLVQALIDNNKALLEKNALNFE